MNYDPTNNDSRRVLASTMLHMLHEAGFVEEKRPGTREKVFSRVVEGTNGRILVLVYTSIVGQMVREMGTDAIRVCAVYTTKDRQERGLTADTRVNRVGDIVNICNRVLTRMREVYKTVKTSERCACGAPKFKSKKGNMVCADLCWMKGRPNHRHGPAKPTFQPVVARKEPDDEDTEDRWANAPLAKQVARMMSQGDDSGYDWDLWANEMKEGGMDLY